MAVPRTFKSILTAVLIFIVFTVLYLSYSNNLPAAARAGLIGHKHPLAETEDLGLVYPNDPIPRINFASYSKYPPHNINEPSKFAFSTFYCTRQPDLRGPYFEAAQQIIWRLLWSPYRSKYPVIIFVCPFIPEENRKIFRGQGAIVKEIELLDDIIPDEIISTKRWIDVLSKLNIWKEVEWKRIVFLDSDAFPVRNIDDIFEVVPVQHCDRETLGPEDKAIVASGGKTAEEFCDYVYSGVSQFLVDNINAGFLVLKPNREMHAKLMRAARMTGDYVLNQMEQGVLGSKNAFSQKGPFPVHRLPSVWNTLPENYIEHRVPGMHALEGLELTEGPVKVLHAKLWNKAWGVWNNLTELTDMWDRDWMNMCRFYDGDPGFVEARKTGIYKTMWEKFLEKTEAEQAAAVA